MRMIKAFIVLAAVAVMMITPAAAQFFGPALASPAGGYAPGFSESTTWSQGAGAATNADAFFSGAFSPFGAPFGGCFPCGFGLGGFAQNGVGTNFGAQNSVMGEFTHTESFGLGQPVGLAFGIPVPGPAGLYYC